MNVLKNNYEPPINQNINTPIKAENPWPHDVVCEFCKSELEYDKSDMHVGQLGLYFLTCPCCGEEICLDFEDPVILTVDNVDFPIHFHRTSVETGAVDICNNQHIREYLRNAIEYFRKNKHEYEWFVECGNLYIGVRKFESDEMYDVMITNDYYSTVIDFQLEDY